MDRRYKKRIERYWKKMKEKGSRSLSNLDMESWFDYWHTHPDWEGKGNRCLENRCSAVELGYQLLQQTEILAASRGSQVQAWTTICDNTLDNAVYLHSENPTGTPYPHAFEDCMWGLTEIPNLSVAVDLNHHEIGCVTYSSGVLYVIRRKA